MLKENLSEEIKIKFDNHMKWAGKLEIKFKIKILKFIKSNLFYNQLYIFC